MLWKLLLVTLGCLYAASAIAGGCQGQACRYLYFGEDKQGCLEIRNSGREDVEVMVYSGVSVPTTVRVAGGDTEKVYKTGRTCIPAADYRRSEAQFAGGPFSPAR
jgi:hypothetical protein